jgi:hypothetical protein
MESAQTPTLPASIGPIAAEAAQPNDPGATDYAFLVRGEANGIRCGTTRRDSVPWNLRRPLDG